MKISKKKLTRRIQYCLIKYNLTIFLRFFLFLRTFRSFLKTLSKPKQKIFFSKKNFNPINNFEYKFSSQNNEDGIIEYIFDKIPNNKIFYEIGFEFNEFNSLNLIKKGWTGTLIDGNILEVLSVNFNEGS